MEEFFHWGESYEPEPAINENKKHDKTKEWRAGIPLKGIVS
jgi:hypothetical protein